MKIAEKVHLYMQVARDIDNLPFGQQNLILSDVAAAMKLKHWHEAADFRLCHPRRRAPLAVVQHSILSERVARALAIVSHPNRGWRSRWTVDREKWEARHGPSGLVVRFAPAGPGEWDGAAVNAEEVARALIELHGSRAAQMLARLMRESGQLWSERDGR